MCFIIYIIYHSLLYFPQKASKDDETIFERDIWELVKDKSYRNQIYPTIFKISNRIRDHGKINELKKAIENLTKDRKIKVPLLWFKVKEKLKATGEKWLEWDRVKEIAKAEGLKDEKTLQAALHFLHRVGDLVYFSDMREFVVIDPQWLINMLSKVITIPGYREQQGGQCDACHWTKLEREGILHKDVCKAVWPEGTVDGLIAIMMKYALLMPNPSRKGKSQEKTYLVPSLLEAKPHKDSAAHSKENSSPPIKLVPPSNFIPVGLTSRLITTLINEEGWHTLGIIYKDAATFEFKQLVENILISVCQVNGNIEVRCRKNWSGAGNVLSKSLRIIHSTLKTLSNNQVFKHEICCVGCKSWIGIDEPEDFDERDSCPVDTCRLDRSAYSKWFISSGFVSLQLFLCSQGQ